MSMATPRSVSLRRLPHGEQIEDLVLWTNPKQTAAVLGGITAAYCASFAKINVVASVAYALLLAVLGCSVWNYAAPLLKRGPLPVPRALKEGVSEAQVRSVAEKATSSINTGLAFTNRLVTGREPVLTGTVAGVLYLVARLASLVSLLSLAYIGVLLLFTLPKVYEMRKDQIDAALDALRAQATATHDKYIHPILSKIPRATPAESATKKTE